MAVIEMKYESEKSAFKIAEGRIKEHANEATNKLAFEKATLESEVQNIREDIQELNVLLHSKEQLVQDAASSIFMEQAKCNESIEKEMQKIACLEKEIKRMAAGIQKLEKTQSDLKEKSLFFTQLNALQAKLESEIATEERLVISKQQIAKEEAQAEAKLEATSNSQQEIEESIATLAAEKLAIETKCTETSKLIKNIKSRLSKFNEEKNSLVLERSFQEAANASMRVKSTQQDLEMLETNLNSFRAEHAECEKKILEIEKKQEEVTKELAKAEEALGITKYKKIEVKIEELKYLCNIVKEVHENDKRYLIIMRRQISAYKLELRELKERLGLIKPSKELLISKIDKVKAKSAQLETELETLVQAEDYDKAAQVQARLEETQEELAKLNGSVMT
eukprot:TRINITY_DN4044_c0_g2_i1.p4 TRINITY_DN4044_c0_g2~~TRINITY_DN4044_c0_g2_i1.p4  ORF type:complete len:394 (-),score=155.36 TRINITY_DN4044_c0_g2_i1:2846-4027(-)